MKDSRQIVVIGGSAGGVEAISELVKGLPDRLNAAVFIVLHIPPHTPSHLPDILQRLTSLPVVSSEDGAPIENGRIYVAPPDRHLLVERHGVRLTRGPRECRAWPAVDVLFRSAAAAFGARTIGIVLSGMLDDGTAGLWAIKDRGGIALIQDPGTAEYPSMPESAQRHVVLDGIWPVTGLATEVARLTVALPDALHEHEVAAARESLAIENLIAMEGNGLRAGVLKLGRISEYTCPDCHGVLVQITEGSIVRFRCHTGHAFSVQSLLAEVNEAIDTGLWDTLRAVEERILLLQQMAAMATEAGETASAERCHAQAAEADSHVGRLRELVLKPALFGHSPSHE